MYTFSIYSSFIIFIYLFNYNQATENYTRVLIKDVDWCDSPHCKNRREHTICKFGPECPPADHCETSVDFNKEMKDYIMELHNEKRNKIALGEESKLPENLETAANMKVLQWDIHLEFVARCHSRQCDPEHDICREVPSFSSVGQNIYSKTLKGKETEHPDVQMIIERAVEGTVKTLIHAWYNQIENVPENIYKNWKETSKATAEFTQLIWARTGYLGCGISQEKNDGALKFFVVCNYGWAGNLKGKQIFVPGKPCSECLKGKKCNTHFKGLCGEIEEYPLRCPCEEKYAEGSTEPITTEE